MVTNQSSKGLWEGRERIWGQNLPHILPGEAGLQSLMLWKQSSSHYTTTLWSTLNCWKWYFLFEGYDDSYSHLSNKQTHATSPLPWVRRKTTSLHSACVLVGWPPLGPYTLLFHRTNTLSCHGRWLLYWDQNLNKLKPKKRLVRFIKMIIYTFTHFNCSNKTHQADDEAPLCLHAERPQVHVCSSPAHVEGLDGIC